MYLKRMTMMNNNNIENEMKLQTTARICLGLEV